MMIERPILFSAEMVRAILEGRKTQTRRLIKPQPTHNFPNSNTLILDWPKHYSRRITGPLQDGCIKEANRFMSEDCPYGQPGDRLWVRETWKVNSFMEGDPITFQFKADGTVMEENGFGKFAPNFDNWYERICWKSEIYLKKINFPLSDNFEGYEWTNGKSPLPWQPSIFMPRWASRITLEIVNIRVERVQEISEEDAIAEGAQPILVPPDGGSTPSTEGYRELWDFLNAKRGYGWNVNPWVWVIEFKKVEG